MDLVASYQGKLVDFRIKELKDVLSRADISKQGKKQDLMDRILALLYDEGTPGLLKNLVNGKEGVMEIIDDVHRKMLDSGVNDLTLKKQNSSGTSRVQLKEEDEGSFHLDMKIRCICGDASSNELLIQCEDPNCRVWQHVHCAIISEKTEDIPLPTQFFCEVCRVKRADPFWETLAHPLHPVMLAVSSIPTDGGNPLRSVKKSFQLTRADRDLLKRAEYDVQAWCMLLNDNVPFRMQWPQYADLQVNGMPVQTVNRPGSQLLGPNGRDDGARISLFILEGGNKVTLSGCDARCFCFGIRLVKRRTLQQVLCMIPKESDGDSFVDALARVQHCIGGGMSTAKEDSDSDLEVIADSITVNVRCPMSGSRMKTAGRFKACAHMGCFDLETFVKLNERSRKWQCPICLKNFCIEDIVIDPYFNGIVTLMQKAGEEMTEIDVKPNGCWRVKNADEFKDLETWHHPDGTAITSSSESSKLDENENASREYSSKLHTQSHSTNEKIGELHNRCHFYNNIPNDQSEEFDQKLIKMNSTFSGDARDDEDTGIKKDGGELTGILSNDENEINSVLHNYGPIHTMVDQSSSAPAANIDLIVLSDSEDEVSFVYPKSVSTDFPCDELPASCQTSNSCDVDFVGRSSVLTGNGNDLLMPQFPNASSSNAVSGSHFSGIDTKVSDIVIDLEQTSVTCSGRSSSCSLPSEFTMNPGSQVLNSRAYLYNAGPVNGLGGNNFGSGDDISLQGFFPTQFALGNQLQVLSSIHGEDWGCCSSNNEARAESPNANGADLGLQFKSKEASLLPNMDGESGPVPAISWKRKEGPFSFPRRMRSARRQPNL